MKTYTTLSLFNCGPCAFINLTEMKANKKTEMELSRTGKLKPFKASLYSAFLFWANKYNIDLTVYTGSKKLNDKMFELMIRYEKIPEKLREKYKAQARKRFDGLNRKFFSKVKGLKDPIKKLDKLLARGNRVAVLNSNFYLNGHSSVPHWIVAYGKKEGKYCFMCSVRGLITLSRKDLLKGFDINKRQGYAPVLIGYKKLTRILVVGDLHGRKPVIRFKNFDCMVVVGDVCDDREIAPIHKACFKKLAEGGEDISLSMNEFIIKKLGSLKKLEGMEKRSLKRGAEVMKYLGSFGKPIFMVAGNWDQSYGKSRIENRDKSDYNYFKSFYDFYLGDRINPKLIGGLRNVRDCMFRCHEFGGINFVGYGLSSGSEDLGNKRKICNMELSKVEVGKLEKAYTKIVDKLAGGFLKRKNKKLVTFFISHNVPYGTKLDVVKDKKSYVYGKHLGSMVARRFCLKFKPVVCVGGHIHEGKGRDRIGKTVVVNPGMGNVLVDVDNNQGKVKKVRFA